MKLQREFLDVIEFDGLEIRDYTAGHDVSSSLAEIAVPAGARHQRARSRRSDKYYYVLEGEIAFTVADRIEEISSGDMLVIRKGTPFRYENTSGAAARLLLVHTPPFDLADEEFLE